MELDFEHMNEDERRAFEESLTDYMHEIEVEEADVFRVLNPARLEQMQLSYALLKYMAGRTGAQVSYKLCEPFRSMGSITMEGENLTFWDAKYFNRIMQVADNMEVYPLKKNRVRLSFTFYHMTTIVEEGA